MKNIVEGISKHYMYRHIRLDTGQPFYIGIGTRTEKEMISGNNERAKKKQSRNRIWKRIVDKAGYDIEILIDSNNYDFIKQKEIEFIKLYGRIDKGTGILANLTDGGDGSLGWNPSGDTRQRMSENRKGEKNHRYGKKLDSDQQQKMLNGIRNSTYIASVETRKRMSESGKRRAPATEQTRNKLSIALKGHVHSDETKRKLSIAAKNKKIQPPHFGNKVIDTSTGIIYSSVVHAAIVYGKSNVSLRNKLIGKYKNDTTFIYYTTQNS